MTMQKEVGSIQKQISFKRSDSSMTFPKTTDTSIPLFHVNFGQLMLYLDPVGIKFQLLNLNAPYISRRDVKFLAPALQRFARTPTD